MKHYEYDVIVVGSGPNGLAAAIELQRNGLQVLLIEGKKTIGGGMRSDALTLPGFIHDICSAVHPMAAGSPFFRSLPLEQFGLEYLYPEVCAAHPMDNGEAGLLFRSFQQTINQLGEDGQAYNKLMAPIIESWPLMAADVLGPLRFPKHPLLMARFGLKALTSAAHLVKKFSSPRGQALWTGMAAHSIQSLNNISTSAIGLVLLAAAHLHGWPLPRGGTQSLADALASYFQSLGGSIVTDTYITSLAQLPSSKAVLFDITPRQLLSIAGHRFSSLYQWQLNRYRYGMGVFKIDWALADVVPFTNPGCRLAGTVHIGGTFKEIAAAERLTARGGHPDKPFVLLAQPGVVDPSRAPAGKQALWGYCHVPNGSTKNMTGFIEAQVERFAPGFRERILARHTMNTAEVEHYNPNYIGGDINGGIIDIGQLFTRPALRRSPYRTSAKGLYICSASTPPGGGVHGMGGYHAAQRVLKDLFKKNLSK